jgi:hypothetical protein
MELEERYWLIVVILIVGLHGACEPVSIFLQSAHIYVRPSGEWGSIPLDGGIEGTSPPAMSNIVEEKLCC